MRREARSTIVRREAHLVFGIAELVLPVAEVAVPRDAGGAACELPARVSPDGSEFVDAFLDSSDAQLFGRLDADEHGDEARRTVLTAMP